MAAWGSCRRNMKFQCMSREGERNTWGCWTIVLGWDKIITDLQLPCGKDGDQIPPAFTALGSCACLRRGPSWEIWCKRYNSVSTACPEHAGGCEGLQLWDLRRAWRACSENVPADQRLLDISLLAWGWLCVYKKEDKGLEKFKFQDLVLTLTA